MSLNDVIFDKLLEALREIWEEIENDQYILVQEKYEHFLSVLERMYSLLIDVGLKDFNVKSDPRTLMATGHFYFDKFFLSGKKYEIFLLLLNDLDGMSFSSYKGKVELTVSMLNVWKVNNNE